MDRVEYQYCPHCGTSLHRKYIFQKERGCCPSCGFVHFRDPKVAVIAFVTSRGRVLLIRRGIDPARGKWALPGGYMDAGEMPDEALRRELLEEVGIQIEIERLLDIYAMVGPSQRANGIVLAYAARPSDGGLPTLVGSDDAIDARWFAPDKVPNNLAFESTEQLLDQWIQTNLE